MEVASVIRYCNQLAVFYLFLQSLPDLRPFLNDLHHVSFPSSATQYTTFKWVQSNPAFRTLFHCVCVSELQLTCSQGMAIDIKKGLCVGRQLLVGWSNC